MNNKFITEDDIQIQKNEIESKLEEINSKLKEFELGMVIYCKKCKTFHFVKDLTLYDVQHYVRPYSCNGGDYNVHQDTRVICPECESVFVMPDEYLYKDIFNKVEEIMDNDILGSDDFIMYKPAFKK